MHKTIISGNVTKNGSELRTTQGGDKILGFSVGISNGKDKNGNWRDKTFFDCSLWGKRATALADHITAGKSLTVMGRISAREYNGKAYLQLSVDELTFNNSFEDQQGGGSRPEPSPGGNDDAPPGGGMPRKYSDDLQDDIPFLYEWRI